ncbi:glycosyltransferase family 4 protein [Actinotalea ferrariae]|uniref:glycosyltransferase family 4 protein n=1 Tax=Actinotalea ferrariae TaxID=1386098 RepID=UPI001C8C7206|nr:glycosyltransferase family 4 protein [Actinotalea ferrariae]MBX9244671.1 glycosyltransferase family 4 protein [Actinotalea ferrariae]
MRVFHVSDCYAPRTGGIESQVRDLARAQAAAGHEVHVLTATPGAGGERGGVVQQDDGVAVHRLGTHVPFDLPVNPLAPPRVRELLRDLRPDVVHVHAGVVSPFAFDGARVALGAGVPLAITWHCMLDGAVPAMGALVRRTRWGSAPVALSAVSSAAAERVRDVFRAEVAVVPNGMDLERWAPRPGAAAGPRGGPLRCVATMRLAPRKRGGALVGLVEDVMTQLPEGSLRLDVLGDGPSRPAMQKSVERRGLADVVTLRGRVPRDELRAAYDDAEVFLAPAVLEAFGIAALEARTAGLVVVARRGTGIEEFVTDGVDGVLVDDDAAMARTLVSFVREPERVERLRAHALAHRPRFDWATTLAAADAEYARARALVGAGV